MTVTSKGTTRHLRATFLYVVLIIGTLISVFPLYWMVISSLQSRGETFVLAPQLICHHTHLAKLCQCL